MVSTRAVHVRTNVVNDVVVALVTLGVLAAMILAVLAAFPWRNEPPNSSWPASGGPTRSEPALRPWA